MDGAFSDFTEFAHIGQNSVYYYAFPFLSLTGIRSYLSEITINIQTMPNPAHFLHNSISNPLISKDIA